MLEFAPLLDCNANCPMCPYARSRRSAHLGVVERGRFPQPDDITITTAATTRRILDAAVEAGVGGVLWTGGGEPTIWSPLMESLRYSASLGLQNAIYTNGFRIGADTEFAERLLAPENNMVFVRVSVNAVSPEVVRKHWGVGLNEVRHQWVALERLFRARQRLFATGFETKALVPSLQISTIFDKNNVGDACAICETVARVATEGSEFRGPEDVMVVRPLTIHGRATYSTHDHHDRIVSEIIRVCGPHGEGRKFLEAAHLRLFLGFGLDRVESGAVANYSEVIKEEYAQRDISWSNGCFLTVGPGGIVYFSTSKNCDSMWALGDLRDQSVSEIYHGKIRQQIVETANQHRWGPSVEQPTARTNRLDRIARAIISEELTDDLIVQIRKASLSSHALILD
jgi:uncharacterized Fe-S cluster-containing radical SAM superfamily protein